MPKGIRVRASFWGATIDTKFTMWWAADEEPNAMTYDELLCGCAMDNPDNAEEQPIQDFGTFDGKWHR